MRDKSSGLLTNPEVWQERIAPGLFHALEQWIAVQPFDVTHRSWLDGGLSGSYVAAVWIKPVRGRLQGAVIKLVPPGVAAAESRGVGLAKQHVSHDFFSRHMIETRLAMPLAGSGWHIHVQDIAQDDLAKMVPLADLLDDPTLGDYCEIILREIVEELNSGDGNDPEPITTQSSDFLQDDLGSQRIASVKRFMHEALADPFTIQDEVRIPGRPNPLPNPMRLLTGDIQISPIDVFRGSGHGDLNLHNILVPVEDKPQPAKFRLIDFGRFSSLMPVARDPMKLLLSIAAGWLPGLTPGSSARSSLAELVVRPDGYKASPAVAGYVGVSTKVHRAASTWATSRGLAADWKRQNLLVLTAAALRTVARAEVGLEERWWNFEVAALCVEGLLLAEAGTTRSLTNTPPSAVRQLGFGSGADAKTAAPVSRPEPQLPLKIRFCRVAGDSWRDLADAIRIRPDETRQFAAGHEARAIWEWLEVRGRLDELRGAAIAIGRDDLGRLLEEQ